MPDKHISAASRCGYIRKSDNYKNFSTLKPSISTDLWNGEEMFAKLNSSQTLRRLPLKMGEPTINSVSSLIETLLETLCPKMEFTLNVVNIVTTFQILIQNSHKADPLECFKN